LILFLEKEFAKHWPRLPRYLIEVGRFEAAIRGTICLKMSRYQICFCLTSKEKEAIMLYWSFVFLVISFVAGVFGFGGVSQTAGGIAQTLFYVFLALFVISMVFHLFTGRKRPLV
jgi:uncharacterized membrane protein YtjA (UPF0391 family)